MSDKLRGVVWKDQHFAWKRYEKDSGVSMRFCTVGCNQNRGGAKKGAGCPIGTTQTVCFKTMCCWWILFRFYKIRSKPSSNHQAINRSEERRVGKEYRYSMER